MKSILTFSLLSLFISAGGCEKPAVAPASPTNTGVNVRDRESAAKTPLDQNENQADIDVTASIRKLLVETKMSVDAQNVKVVTQAGKVTLRGPVDSTEEKIRVEEIARTVAGDGNVVSQLEVTPSK